MSLNVMTSCFCCCVSFLIGLSVCLATARPLNDMAGGGGAIGGGGGATGGGATRTFSASSI